MSAARAASTAILVVALLIADPATAAWYRDSLPFSKAGSTALGVAVAQPQHVYLGCGGIGVWGSANYGQTWTNRSGGLPDDVVVLGLEVHPINPNILLAGTAESVDGAPGMERSGSIRIRSTT